MKTSIENDLLVSERKVIKFEKGGQRKAFTQARRSNSSIPDYEKKVSIGYECRLHCDSAIASYLNISQQFKNKFYQSHAQKNGNLVRQIKMINCQIKFRGFRRISLNAMEKLNSQGIFVIKFSYVQIHENSLIVKMLTQPNSYSIKLQIEDSNFNKIKNQMIENNMKFYIQEKLSNNFIDNCLKNKSIQYINICTYNGQYSCYIIKDVQGFSLYRYSLNQNLNAQDFVRRIQCNQGFRTEQKQLCVHFRHYWLSFKSISQKQSFKVQFIKTKIIQQKIKNISQIADLIQSSSHSTSKIKKIIEITQTSTESLAQKYQYISKYQSTNHNIAREQNSYNQLSCKQNTQNIYKKLQYCHQQQELLCQNKQQENSYKIDLNIQMKAEQIQIYQQHNEYLTSQLNQQQKFRLNVEKNQTQMIDENSLPVSQKQNQEDSRQKQNINMNAQFDYIENKQEEISIKQQEYNQIKIKFQCKNISKRIKDLSLSQKQNCSLVMNMIIQQRKSQLKINVDNSMEQENQNIFNLYKKVTISEYGMYSIVTQEQNKLQTHLLKEISSKQNKQINQINILQLSNNTLASVLDHQHIFIYNRPNIQKENWVSTQLNFQGQGFRKFKIFKSINQSNINYLQYNTQSLYYYDVNANENIKILSNSFEFNQIRDIKQSNENQFVFLSKDLIKIIDKREFYAKRQLGYKSHQPNFIKLDVHNEMIVAGQADGLVKIFDLRVSTSYLHALNKFDLTSKAEQLNKMYKDEIPTQLFYDLQIVNDTKDIFCSYNNSAYLIRSGDRKHRSSVFEKTVRYADRYKIKQYCISKTIAKQIGPQMPEHERMKYNINRSGSKIIGTYKNQNYCIDVSTKQINPVFSNKLENQISYLAFSKYGLQDQLIYGYKFNNQLIIRCV